MARTLSMFRKDCPFEGATRNVTMQMRDNEKPGRKDRIRYIMAWRGLACALCGLSGSWTLDLSDNRRFTFGHIVGLTLFGTSNIANYTPQHAFCNDRVKHIPDLRGKVEYIVDSLPSLDDAKEWRDNGGIEYYEPESLPTETAMRMALKGKGFAI